MSALKASLRIFLLLTVSLRITFSEHYRVIGALRCSIAFKIERAMLEKFRGRKSLCNDIRITFNAKVEEPAAALGLPLFIQRLTSVHRAPALKYVPTLLTSGFVDEARSRVVLLRISPKIL